MSKTLPAFAIIVAVALGAVVGHTVLQTVYLTMDAIAHAAGF
jgi:hypothetical protein